MVLVFKVGVRWSCRYYIGHGLSLTLCVICAAKSDETDPAFQSHGTLGLLVVHGVGE